MNNRRPEPAPSEAGLRALFDLAEYLVNDHPIPECSRTLVAGAIDAGVSSGFRVEFYQALGLRTWGGISPLERFRLDRRDRILCRLKAAVPEWAELSPNAASKSMVASASRYQATRWPRDKLNAEGPVGQPLRTWWSILKGGMKLPGERRLAQILASEIQERFEFPSSLVNLVDNEERFIMPDRPTSSSSPIDVTLDRVERLAAAAIPSMPRSLVDTLRTVDRLMPVKPGCKPIDAATIADMLKGPHDD